MSNDDVRSWLRWLDDDPATQRNIVLDLLRHAHEDGMTVEDRAECHEALRMLDAMNVVEAMDGH